SKRARPRVGSTRGRRADRFSTSPPLPNPPAPLMPRTHSCTPATALGRLRKAEQFLDAATTIRELAADETDVSDAFVTLLVHAGIAAADAICCRVLGEHARGDDHGQAVQLVGRVRPDGAELA